MPNRSTASALLVSALTASISHANLIFQEGGNDWSDDGLNPTAFSNLGLGTNAFIMHVVDSDSPNGDRDYFSITLGAGQAVDSIVLVSSINPGGGVDATAFIAMQYGPQVTVDPNAPNPGLLAGFVIGSPNVVGTDILNDLTGGAGGPLGPGTYSFWVQQTGVDLTRVELAFNVIPAPGGTALLAGTLLFVSRRRR
jgi:hypothetical protein